MTQEMIDLANKNSQNRKTTNVEFRLGACQSEIENMPVEKDSVDAIISNSVVNELPQ